METAQPQGCNEGVFLVEVPDGAVAVVDGTQGRRTDDPGLPGVLIAVRGRCQEQATYRGPLRDCKAREAAGHREIFHEAVLFEHLNFLVPRAQGDGVLTQDTNCLGVRDAIRDQITSLMGVQFSPLPAFVTPTHDVGI